LWVYPFLVTEGDWFKRKQCFAGLFHWLNFLFKPTGGGSGAKFAVCINEDANSSGRRFAEDGADIATVVDVRTGGADTNNVIGRSDAAGGISTHGDIADAGRVEFERTIAQGCVGAAVVASERKITGGRVEVASGIESERLNAIGRVAAAAGVALERICTGGRIS